MLFASPGGTLGILARILRILQIPTNFHRIAWCVGALRSLHGFCVGISALYRAEIPTQKPCRDLSAPTHHAIRWKFVGICKILRIRARMPRVPPGDAKSMRLYVVLQVRLRTSQHPGILEEYCTVLLFQKEKAVFPWEYCLFHVL